MHEIDRPFPGVTTRNGIAIFFNDLGSHEGDCRWDAPAFPEFWLAIVRSSLKEIKDFCLESSPSVMNAVPAVESYDRPMLVLKSLSALRATSPSAAKAVAMMAEMEKQQWVRAGKQLSLYAQQLFEQLTQPEQPAPAATAAPGPISLSDPEANLT